MNCPQCGNELIQEYNYCDNCGVSLVYEKSRKTKKEPSNELIFKKEPSNENFISSSDLKNNNGSKVLSRLFLFLIIIFILYVMGSFALSILSFIGVIFLGFIFLVFVFWIFQAIFK